MSWESKARYLEELRTKGNNDYDKVVEDMKNIERCIKAIIDNAIVWQISSDVAVKRIKNMKLNDLSLSDLIKKYLKGELVER